MGFASKRHTRRYIRIYQQQTADSKYFQQSNERINVPLKQFKLKGAVFADKWGKMSTRGKQRE